jgi:hypothetical protein
MIRGITACMKPIKVIVLGAKVSGSFSVRALATGS